MLYWVFAVGILSVTSGCLGTTGQTAGQYADDAAITTAVKSKLGNDRMVNLTRVDVTTVNGTVHLMGVVENQDQKKRIGSLASQVKGVKRVDNNLQIQRPIGDEVTEKEPDNAKSKAKKEESRRQ